MSEMKGELKQFEHLIKGEPAKPAAPSPEAAKAFPEERIGELITRGFLQDKIVLMKKPYFEIEWRSLLDKEMRLVLSINRKLIDSSPEERQEEMNKATLALSIVSWNGSVWPGNAPITDYETLKTRIDLLGNIPDMILRPALALWMEWDLRIKSVFYKEGAQILENFYPGRRAGI